MPKEAKTKESGLKTDHIKDMKMTDDGIVFEIDDDLFSDDEEVVVEGEDGEEVDEEVDEDDEIIEEEEEVKEKISAKGKGKAALPDKYDARISALESGIAEIKSLLIKGMAKPDEVEEEEADEEVTDEDLQNPRTLLGVIEKRVGKTLDKRLATTEKQVQAANVRAMFDDAYARHGEPFKAVSRTVADILAKTLKSDGTLGMTVDEAFEFVQQHKLTGGQSTTVQPKKKLSKTAVLRQTQRRRVDADDEDEVVNTETRQPLQVKGRSIKDTAYEALRLLSRGDSL